MSDDTGRTDMQDMTLGLLREIRDELCKLKEEQTALKKKIGELSVDVNVVHEFQKSFAGRLSAVEKFCVSQPLHTTPIPYDCGRDGGDGR